jgi:hypothetical protein
MRRYRPARDLQLRLAKKKKNLIQPMPAKLPVGMRHFQLNDINATKDHRQNLIRANQVYCQLYRTNYRGLLATYKGYK